MIMRNILRENLLKTENNILFRNDDYKLWYDDYTYMRKYVYLQNSDNSFE